MTGKPRLRFVGIGFMGEAMNLRLPERGRRVTVWQLTADAVRLHRILV